MHAHARIQTKQYKTGKLIGLRLQLIWRSDSNEIDLKILLINPNNGNNQHSPSYECMLYNGTVQRAYVRLIRNQVYVRCSDVSEDYTNTHTHIHSVIHASITKRPHFHMEWQAIFIKRTLGKYICCIYHHFDTNYSMALEILQRCIPIKRDCLRAHQQHD